MATAENVQEALAASQKTTPSGVASYPFGTLVGTGSFRSISGTATM